MDDQQLGIRIRAARVRRRWTQKELARRARVSPAQVSRLERGHVHRMSMAAIRAIAAALEIRLEWLARSRAGDLDRLVNAAHASLGESVTVSILRADGWIVRPEVSFSIYGERGVIDLLAWHPKRRALLVIELKTEIVDVGEALGTLDRKRRLAGRVARDLGWAPITVSCWLIVAGGRTNRRRLAAHAATFRAALPIDGRKMRGWLLDPDGEVRAASMWPSDPAGILRPRTVARRRVRPPRSCMGSASEQRKWGAQTA